jgi:hypothetical protein
LDVDAFGARAFLDLLVDVVVDWLGAGAAIGGSVGRRASCRAIVVVMLEC